MKSVPLNEPVQTPTGITSCRIKARHDTLTAMRTSKNYTPNYKPIKPQGRQSVAVAIESREQHESTRDSQPIITAAGRGKLAQEILEVAFANGIKVREDCDLAELLVQLELDTPIPSEAILVVAEILAKVYEANEAASSTIPTRDTP